MGNVRPAWRGCPGSTDGQFNGTNQYDPLVIAAVIGRPWVATGAALITAVVALTRRHPRRRRGITAAGPTSARWTRAGAVCRRLSGDPG